MKAIWRGFKALLLVALGAVLAVGLGQCGKNTFPSHWFTIKELRATEDNSWNGTMSWSNELMKKAESLSATLPQPKQLKGRAKFVTSGQREQQTSAPLGYEIELLLQSKDDMKRALEKAKKEGKVGTWEAKVAPSHVWATVDFVLRDKDGFALATLDGQQDFYDSFGVIQPGEPALLKGTTKESVSVADANATETIECVLSLDNIEVTADDFLDAE